MSKLKTYQGNALSQISFPLGGIGTGCIGIGGDGRLIDWEIFNKPSKGSRNGSSHFAIRALKGSRVVDARVLNGEALPPYTGTFVGNGKDILRSFGFGIPSETMPGVPNFRKCTFCGETPFADLTFTDPKFPGIIRMEAFNPLIPNNEDDSGIPAAFFRIEVENNTKDTLTYEPAFSLRNPTRKSHNYSVEQDGFRIVRLDPAEEHEDILKRGNMSIAVDGGDKQYVCENYLQRSWQGDVGVYWREFMEGKEFRQHTCPPGNFDYAAVSARIKLKPGEKKSVRFLIAWYYPQTYNYWKPRERVIDGEKVLAKPWRNYYATVWKSSSDAAAYALKNWDRLYEDSMTFRKAFHSQSVPRSVLDAASCNISILKTPTCLRLEDGTFWGWEGLHADVGSCFGTCQHVWSYAYALPFLFPRLQRSIHTLSYSHNVTKNGGLTFRVLLPLNAEMKCPFRPAVDAQFAELLCTYRDWKISGDDQWLKKIWPNVKRTVEYTWSKDNEDRWDPKKSGVITGRQHHTLDQELFGPNSWLTGLYLAALEAAAEMAEAFGDKAFAKECLALVPKGKKYIKDKLFNGKWFIQEVDVNDKSILSALPNNMNDPWYPGGFMKFYWEPEYKQIITQIGEGCEIDQCLAQWHTQMLGLPSVFDAKQFKSAMQSIYKHNYIRRMGDFHNPACRVFALNDESGVVICTWPKPDTQPIIPLRYHSECMYGFEYAAAAEMIQAGMVKEGLEIVEKGRARFDGVKRNPWNEFECGSNYARSMASYSLLNILSGFQFDMRKNEIGFEPVLPGPFTAFWSLEGAWGTVKATGKNVTLTVLGGTLNLKSFRYGNKVWTFPEVEPLSGTLSMDL